MPVRLGALLLFPWRHTEWERQPRPEDGTFQPPKFDVNAPDLYVPLMAFTTYVLLVGFVMGAAGNFQPDVFGTTTSSGVVTVVLEVIAIKLAFYLLQGSRISILELLAFSGYKFLSVCLTLLAYQLPYQPWPGHAVLLYAGAAIGTFTAKSLRRSLVQDAGGFTPGFMTEGMGSPTKRDAWKKQNYGLVAVGLMQIKPSTAADPNVGIKGVAENPDRNVEAGVKYLRFLADSYFQDLADDPVNQAFFALALKLPAVLAVFYDRRRAIQRQSVDIGCRRRDQYHLHAQFREGVEVIVSQPPLPKKIPKSDPYLVWRKQCVFGVLGSSDAVLPRHPHNMVPTGTGTIKQWAIHHQA